MDTLGLIWRVWVHSAAEKDSVASLHFVKEDNAIAEKLKVVWADLGYKSDKLNKAIKENWNARLEIKKHPWQGDQRVWVKDGEEPPPAIPKPAGFVVLPKRWVVERTFAWLNLHRRHSKDYETLPCQSVFFIYLSMIRNMMNFLSKKSK